VELPHQRPGGQNRSFRGGKYGPDHQSIGELTVFLPAALTLSAYLFIFIGTVGSRACGRQHGGFEWFGIYRANRSHSVQFATSGKPTPAPW
jgi:hypothetical protein